MKKEMGKLFKALASQGWSVEKGRKHVKAKSPNGALVTLPATPSDHRSYLNSRAQLRRAVPRF